MVLILRTLIYNVIENVVSQRHVYVSEDGIYAIWFDGRTGWVVGSLSDIKEGILTYGYLFNTQITDCPFHSDRWIEWYLSSWDFGDAEIKCLQTGGNF